MRTLIAWTLTVAVGGWAIGTASGQGMPPAQKKGTAPATVPATKVATPAPKATPAAAKAKVDQSTVQAQQIADEKAVQEMNDLLDDWEAQSKKVTSLDVGFVRIDKMGPAWGDVYYKGRAMLKSPDLACLEFTKYKVGGDRKVILPMQPEKEPSERIVCNGEEVLQFEWDEQAIYVYPLEKEVRQKALQQGPLPFLFNMKADKAKMRYSMSLLKQDDKEYLIGIVPREEIDKQSFSQAFLWLNKQTFLPNKLRLYPVGDKELQEFKFDVILANQPMNMQVFNPVRDIKGWKVIRNPQQNAQAPKAAPGVGTVRAPQGQAPAKRAAMQPVARPNTRPQ